MTSTSGRIRALSRAAAAALALAVTAGLAACAPQEHSGDLTEVRYQTSWLRGVGDAASYVALDKGFYKDAGITVDVLAGGPDIASESMVTAGSATVGTSGSDNVAHANAEGADLVIIGADYQANPFEVISLSDNAISVPADLVGKRIGVASGNTVPFNAFLEANDIPESDVTIVPVGFDMAPLTSGEVDGIVGFRSTRIVTLGQAGIDAVGLAFQDYGLPMLSHVYFATRESVEKNRDALVAFLVGQVRGWRAVEEDPDAAVSLVVDQFGTAQNLDPDQQRGELDAILDDMKAPDGRIITMSDEAIAASVETLKKLGIAGVSAALYDPTLIEDAYKEIGE